MNYLSIVIDDKVHQYVEIPVSEYSCNSCSLIEYCTNSDESYHLCRIFDLSGNCRPTGKFGHFKIINHE